MGKIIITGSTRIVDNLPGFTMNFTRLLLLLLVVCSVAQLEARRKPNNNNNNDDNIEEEETDDGTEDNTDDGTEDETDDDSDDSSSDSAYAATVKALIDANSCGSVSTNDNCGDDAMGYYETFEYNGNRVIIVSGAPDHDAESELFVDGGRFNPNTRCERWQYSVVPLNPVKSTSTDWSSYDKYPYYGMGVYGYATSGGTFFDTRSSPTGDTAWNNEIDTLDTCMGHSNEALQYHYHGVPYCIPNDTWLADDPEVCQFVGYMLDGFPVYGRCQHTNGDELESCWTSTSSDPSHLSDYTYGSTASGNPCYLDEANGYKFTDGQTSDGYVGYAYVTTTEFSGVPIGFMGSEFGDICGFTP